MEIQWTLECLCLEDRKWINNWLTCSQRHMIQEDHHLWMLLNLLQHPGARGTDKLSSCCHCCKNHTNISMKYDITPRTKGWNRYQMIKEWGSPQYCSSTSQQYPKGEHLPKNRKVNFTIIIQVSSWLKDEGKTWIKKHKKMKTMDHVSALNEWLN
jgi:hypothetical protein